VVSNDAASDESAGDDAIDAMRSWIFDYLAGLRRSDTDAYARLLGVYFEGRFDQGPTRFSV
jgi:hypothetical protein